MNSKRFVLAMAASAAAVAGMPGTAEAADVAFSLTIGQPDFYGRLDVGDFRPQLLNRTPVVIERSPRVVQQPVYLRVPPGHEKHWSKHCREYNACGQPVYFVRDEWYRNQYAPRYRETHHEDNDRRDDRRDDRHDGDRDHDRGHRD